VPFAKLAADLSEDSKLRKLLTNMVYVGIVAELLGIERDEMINALGKQFKGKKKAIDANVAAIDKGLAYAKENLPPQNKWRVERMNATQGKIIIDGNAAAAIGSIFGGVTVVTWYPITPSSSLCESIIEYAKQTRIEENGKATFAVVQAEDELAAVGMVLGAGWAGARSMTSTAGPGISLMAEFVGLGYFAELPGVIWDIQRVGPSTGLPTRTAQGDVNQVAYLSHGDTQAHRADSVERRGMLRLCDRSARSRRGVPDAGLRPQRSRPRHEQLDVRSVRISDQADHARQGAHRGEAHGAAGQVGPL
jgi:2-oxoglutarate ferredoxin oxidoreductase subunit alpha